MSNSNKSSRYQEFLRLAGYFMFSLSFGIMVALIVSNIDDMLQENRLKRSVKRELEGVVKSYQYMGKDASPDATAEFVKNYISYAMNDKIAAFDSPASKKKTGRMKHLLSVSYDKKKIDIYVKNSYLDQLNSYGIDLPDVIEGFIVTLVVFTSLVVYSGKKRQTIAIRKRYEAERQELTNALQKHEALALLGRMTATLAHELKTPIATISNLVQALPARINDETFTNRFISITKEELLRTQQLIDNLLVYGKEIPDTSNEWIDFEPFISDITRNIGMRISSCPGIEVYGDRFYLRLLFENLIRNSLQAGADEVFIKYDRNESIPDASGILFEDNGAGFPKDSDLTELINPFVTSRSKGAGLGLFLAQKIALAHGGMIMPYSPERGAGVRISLPSDRVRSHGS